MAKFTLLALAVAVGQAASAPHQEPISGGLLKRQLDLIALLGGKAYKFMGDPSASKLYGQSRFWYIR
jgi:hypothetical protein